MTDGKMLHVVTSKGVVRCLRIKVKRTINRRAAIKAIEEPLKAKAKNIQKKSTTVIIKIHLLNHMFMRLIRPGL